MKEDIQDLLVTAIKKSLKELKIDKVFNEELYLDLPTDARFGDLSTNIALRLKKSLNKSGLEIANIIMEAIRPHLEEAPLRDYVKEVKAQGQGFINFYLDEKYFHGELREIIAGGKDSIRPDLGLGKSVLIEYVSANPTGPLSVAHARQAAVGDTLANILAFLGFNTKREYYLNDEGNQINILGESVALRIRELNGEEIEFPQNFYQGDYIYDIAKQIKDKKLGLEDISKYAVDYILSIIKKELDDFGVKFDYWYSQKELRQSGKIEEVLGFLREKGFLYEKDGALWFKSTHFQDDKDRVVVKSDGSYTYLAPDIAYHQEKYKRGFKWLINLWGPDHHGYISRLKAAVKALNHEPDSLSIVIVQLASVFREGKSIEMSTRKGQYITLREVLDEVGKDASRFFFLMRRTSSHLDFDLGLAKKQTPENPIFYIQYAYARISSILRQSSEPVTKTADLSALNKKEEIELIKKLWQFPYILKICLSIQDPYMLTVYLQGLAEAFHKFYDLHRVLGEDDALTCARLELIEAVKIIISTGLDLLGISKPEKM